MSNPGNLYVIQEGSGITYVIFDSLCILHGFNKILGKMLEISVHGHLDCEELEDVVTVQQQLLWSEFAGEISLWSSFWWGCDQFLSWQVHRLNSISSNGY